MKKRLSNAFLIELDNQRIRVVLERRKTGGPYHARWWHRGKLYWRSTKCHQERDAKAKSRTLLVEVIGIKRRPLTLAQAIADCIASRWPDEAAMQAHYSHYSVSKIQLEKFRDFEHPDLNLAALPFEDAIQLVQRFIDSRRAAPQTIVGEQKVISRLFSWLIKKRLVTWPANPAFVRFLELPRAHHAPRPPVSPADLKVLIVEAKKSAIWPAVLLCLAAGLRPVGTLRIMRKDIDLVGARLTVTEKGRERQVPLNKWVVAELRAWLAIHPGAMLVDYTRNSLYSHVKKIRDDNGLRPEVTLQGCRRTFISLCMDGGVSAEMVASIAGNSVAVIEKHYKDLRTMNATEAVKHLDLSAFLSAESKRKSVKSLRGHSKNHSTETS